MAERGVLDDILNLEEDYYQEGFAIGLEDGKKLGLAEGRAFGLEQGFDKFEEMGMLHGRATVWSSRLSRPAQTVASGPRKQSAADDESSQQDGSPDPLGNDVTLPQLEGAARLEKHIRTLFALTELETFAMLNNEEDVADFDDRLKRAAIRATIIGNAASEKVRLGSKKAGTTPDDGVRQAKAGEASIEDASILGARH